jgi:uncharacterized membrane protein YcaP (DUF421 family)
MIDSGLASLASIALRAAIVFVLLVLGVRLTGKRQTGEMNLHDLLMIMILANAVQNAMTAGNPRLNVAIVAAGTLILLGWSLAVMVGRHPAWQKWIMGAPTVLVQDGRKIPKNMRREGVSEAELMTAVREQGVAELARVKLAVLEIDGEISVVPWEE